MNKNKTIWILLNDTRQLCWQIWLIFSIDIMSIMLLQTFSGKLDGALFSSWLWALVNIIPGLILIQWSILHNRYPEKLIPKAAHIVIWVSVFLYLSSVLIILFAESWATRTVLSLSTYRIQSFYFLLPFQLLVLSSFYFTFYRKSSFFEPSEENIKDLARKKIDKTNKSKNILKEQCLQLIINSEIAKALEMLYEGIKSKESGEVNPVILLQSQLKRVNQEMDLDLIKPAEGNITKNRITMALLNILN